MEVMGSARVSRAGFGVAPKQSLLGFPLALERSEFKGKFAIARTRPPARVTRALPRRAMGSLLGALFRGVGPVLRPQRRQRQGDDYSNGDFEETVKRNNPRGVRARDEDYDGERDTRITIRSFFHPKCDTDNSDHKHCCRKREQIPCKISRQERADERTQRSSRDAFN